MACRDTSELRKVEAGGPRVAELKFLLTFFSRPQAEQWREVPVKFTPPVCMNVGEYETPTDKPILALAIVLVAHLNGVPAELHEDEDLLDLLDEIRDLVGNWMLETDYLDMFARVEVGDENMLSGYYIWRVLARLCKLALGHAVIGRCSAEGVSPSGLFASYTIEDDEAELQDGLPVR